MKEPRKILAIVFKYLGDVAVTVPALRALREFHPNCEIHVLVAEDAGPLVAHIPWITKVWTISRVRGRAEAMKNWPVVRALKKEKFDRSVDFVGNDRGAILSLLIGAKHRLGPVSKRGFFGRTYCYNQKIPEASGDCHEVLRHLHTLTAWKIPHPNSLELETYPDPAKKEFAEGLMPEGMVLCHITTSQPKKEWPIAHWAELHQKMKELNIPHVFAAGPSPREQGALAQLVAIAPLAKVLPPIVNLGLYMAVLQRARLFVSGDTGPLHFAAGLKVRTISLFAASLAHQWAPIGKRHILLHGGRCVCSGHAAVCTSGAPCMATIPPMDVLKKVRNNFVETKKEVLTLK